MRFDIPRISEARDYILTAFLLVLSVVLLVGRNRQGIDNLRKASITLFSYLQKPLAEIRVYRQALKTNNELRKQNILLLDELNKLRSAKHKNEELRSLLQFSRKSSLSLYPVQIVGKELNQITNVITVDAGTKNDIKQGMPFISAHGLIGQVVLSAGHYAQIMPYSNSLFRLSAKLRDSNAYGIIRPKTDEENLLILQYIPQTVRVDTGEVVISSGYGHQYPSGIPIGKVIARQPKKGKTTQRVTVKPFVDLHTVSAGFVITSKPDSSLSDISHQYQQLFK